MATVPTLSSPTTPGCLAKRHRITSASHYLLSPFLRRIRYIGSSRYRTARRCAALLAGNARIHLYSTFACHLLPSAGPVNWEGGHKPHLEINGTHCPRTALPFHTHIFHTLHCTRFPAYTACTVYCAAGAPAERILPPSAATSPACFLRTRAATCPVKMPPASYRYVPRLAYACRFTCYRMHATAALHPAATIYGPRARRRYAPWFDAITTTYHPTARIPVAPYLTARQATSARA